MQQKHATLRRLAMAFACNEIYKTYFELLRSQEDVFLQQKKISLLEIEKLFIAFCKSLLPLLSEPLIEISKFVVHHAIDDIIHKESQLLEESGIQVSPREMKQHSADAIKFSQNSQAEYVGKFAMRAADAAKEVMQGFSSPSESKEYIRSATDRLKGLLWNLRRIIFTETCSTYNFTQLMCYSTLSESDPKFHVRWCERIDDRDGSLRHKNVSSDSIELHGQIVRPRSLFIGKDENSWFHPPNRPYDHAVLMFWHPTFDRVPVWKHK